MKKTLVVLSILALAAFATSSAMAASILGVDDGSFALIAGDNDVRASVRNANSAATLNFVSTTASTGNNTIEADDDDVEDVAMITGDAVAGTFVTNQINTNLVDLMVDARGCECGEASIVGVDDRSAAVIVSDNDIRASTSNWNRAFTLNAISTDASTGNNMIDGDDEVEDALMLTGTAAGVAELTNLVNYNDVVVTVRR